MCFHPPVVYSRLRGPKRSDEQVTEDRYSFDAAVVNSPFVSYIASAKTHQNHKHMVWILTRQIYNIEKKIVWRIKIRNRKPVNKQRRYVKN